MELVKVRKLPTWPGFQEDLSNSAWLEEKFGLI